MKPFVLTPRAEQDVSDIWDYIADDNIEAANRVLDVLESTMLKLAKNPGIGHWREELTNRRQRFFLVYSYLSSTATQPSPCRLFGFSMPPATCRASLAWCRTSRRLLVTLSATPHLLV
jgi:plasmid stabilization system protein ParE